MENINHIALDGYKLYIHAHNKKITIKKDAEYLDTWKAIPLNGLTFIHVIHAHNTENAGKYKYMQAGKLNNEMDASLTHGKSFH